MPSNHVYGGMFAWEMLPNDAGIEIVVLQNAVTQDCLTADEMRQAARNMAASSEDRCSKGPREVRICRRVGELRMGFSV